MADSKVKITAETAEAERALKALGSEVIGLSGKMGSLAGAAGALGGVLSISAFVGFIKSSIDAADHLNDLSKVTSLTVEQLAGISLAAKQSGSSLDATAHSISKLSENMGKDSEKFAKLGVSAKDPIEAFKQLADIFNEIQDPQQKAAFAAEAFGKSWKEVAPLLAEGSERIGEMIDRGTALSGPMKEAAERADQFNDQIAELEAQSRGLGISLANVMLPGLTKTATAMNELAREGHPVLALWRGLAGMGEIAWDFIFPPENLAESLKSTNRVKELKEELFDMERHLRTVKGGGMISRALYGSKEELERDIAMTKAQIETIEKHAAKLDKKSDTSKPPKKVPAGVGAFIGGDGDDDKDYSQKIDDMLAREQAKYDKLHEMALEFNATAAQRAQMKMDFDLVQLEKEHTSHINSLDEYTNTEEDKAALEASYQQARADRKFLGEAEITKIEKDEAEKRMVASKTFGVTLAQFEKQNTMQRTQTMAAGLMQMTAVGAQNNRALFEINKIASLANATISGVQAVQDSYKFGATWGGPAGGAAMAAIAVAATAANLAAINSTSFGGGGPSAGGGGVPSLATSPGIPVSPQPSEPPVAAKAALPTSVFNMTVLGAKDNPDAPAISYNTMVNEIIPLWNEAKNNGHLAEINLVAG